MKKKILALFLIGCMAIGGCAEEKTKPDVIAESELDEEKIAKEIAESEALEEALGIDTEEDEDVEGSSTDSVTEENSESDKEDDTQNKVKTITITATGDCTLGKTQKQGYDGSFAAYYDSRGEEYFFEGVRDVFEADDFTLINLECVLTTSTDRVEKTYNLKGDPSYVGIMTSSSVEGCTLGNNHSSDYGPQSLTDTQNALDGAGIIYGYNEHIGKYTTDDGLTIGVVSANVLSQNEQYINYLKDGIQTLKNEGTDLVIACCHWGIEREYYPYEFQQTLAHSLVDSGADLVIGTHPHVLQGVELYNGKVICYSLGNFCFGGNRNPSDKDTMMYQQTFTYIDGQLQTDVNAQIIPCTISSASGYNDFQPTIATDSKKQSIIDNVNTYSSSYSNICFDAEGKLMLKE